MELRQLRHFVAVVDSGNLSRAAQRVAISQPALTRSIKNLEDLLGVQLLERKPRGVAPTEAGLALYQQAQVVLNACNRLTREVRERKFGVTGIANLGIAPMFASYLVDDVLLELAAERPGLRVTVTEGFFEPLLRELLDGRIDLMFCNLPLATIGAELTFEPLLTVTSSVVAGQKHPLFRKRDVTRAALVEQRWAVVDQPHSLDNLEKFFAIDGLPTPRDVFRTNSLTLMRALVLSGGFISTLPEHLIDADLQDGRLKRLPIAAGSVQRQAGLIYRTLPGARPSVQIVLEALRAAAKARA
jgi:DNA-binding transcriptional LysR family regulator